MFFFLLRYARAERELKQARPYGEGAKQFFERNEIEAKPEDKKELFIAMTSDRGEFNHCLDLKKLLKLIKINV